MGVLYFFLYDTNYLVKLLNLKGDIMKENIFNLENSYAQLPPLFYSHQQPEHVPDPHLKVLNYSLCKELGIDADMLNTREGIEILSGNRIPKGSISISQAYAGHQFGYFTMLGDGRAVLLGEQIDLEGRKFDVTLKGSGRTPYSRGGDGKATLGPMLREYIISEAMNNLKIPTTRSLSVVTTGEKVIRDEILEGAVLTRIASSHIRVGTFQYIASHGDEDDLKLLADYTLLRHFKDWINEENRYLFILKEIIKRQAELIASWQLVGFIHGVMNTDNMALSGETIDYGPCAFMDTYDPDIVFSSIDVNGRYAYKNQPYIALWNLARLSEAVISILNDDESKAIEAANNALKEFNTTYEEKYISGMRKKIGLFNKEEKDTELISELLNLMYKYKADYTNTFKMLTMDDLQDSPMYGKEDFNNWYKKWNERLTRQDESKEESLNLMKKNNPAVIPRNHRVEEALKHAVEDGDYSYMNNLMEVLKNPYEYSKEQEEYSKLPPKCNTPYRTFCGT